VILWPSMLATILFRTVKGRWGYAKTTSQTDVFYHAPTYTFDPGFDDLAGDDTTRFQRQAREDQYSQKGVDKETSLLPFFAGQLPVSHTQNPTKNLRSSEVTLPMTGQL